MSKREMTYSEQARQLVENHKHLAAINRPSLARIDRDMERVMKMRSTTGAHADTRDKASSSTRVAANKKTPYELAENNPALRAVLRKMQELAYPTQRSI